MSSNPFNTGWLSFGLMNKGPDRSGMSAEHFRSSVEVLGEQGESGAIIRIPPVALHFQLQNC